MFPVTTTTNNNSTIPKNTNEETISMISPSSQNSNTPTTIPRSESRADIETNRVLISRKESHLPSIRERISYCLKSVVLSNAYGFFYAIIIFLNLVLIIWMMLLAGKLPTSPLFSIIDGITISALVFELTVGMITKGRGFFSELSSWFDLIVCVMSISSLISLHTMTDMKYQTSLSVALFLMMGRYATSLLRLITLIRRSRQINHEELEMIDLDKFSATANRTPSPRLDPISAANNNNMMMIPSSFLLSSSPRLHLNDHIMLALRKESSNSTNSTLEHNNNNHHTITGNTNHRRDSNSSNGSEKIITKSVIDVV
jgi:hypothetical protein